MLLGVGLAAFSKEKVEAVAKELVQKGEVTEQEGKEFISELLDKSDEARKEFEAKIENMVKGILNKMEIATKEDLSRIEKRITEIEALCRKE